jgi:hypothetical protein
MRAGSGDLSDDVAADRAARAALLMRIVAAALGSARPPLASTVDLARTALDALRTMASSTAWPPSQIAFEAMPVDTIATAARIAQLPEIGDIDFRHKKGQEPTWPEECAWRRVELFAHLIRCGAAARDTQSTTRSAGAGLAAAY